MEEKTLEEMAAGINMRNKICSRFAKGRCSFGAKCRFSQRIVAHRAIIQLFRDKCLKDVKVSSLNVARVYQIEDVGVRISESSN